MAGFYQIYSIELSKAYYETALQNCAAFPQVTILEGKSAEILPRILKDIDRTATFWLYAHYSGGETTRGEKLCPVIEELAVIETHPIKNHTILIDDRRLFGTDEFDFVSEAVIKAAIIKINPNYQFSYASEVAELPDDILAATV
jgi:hypothetical protein